jgi:hypothetical protein
MGRRSVAAVLDRFRAPEVSRRFVRVAGPCAHHREKWLRAFDPRLMPSKRPGIGMLRGGDRGDLHAGLARGAQLASLGFPGFETLNSDPS